MTRARVLVLAAENIPDSSRGQFHADGFDLIQVTGLADFLFSACTGEFDLLLADHAACAGSDIDIEQALASVPELMNTPILIYGTRGSSVHDCESKHIQSAREPLASEEVRLRMHATVRRMDLAGTRRILSVGDLKLDTERLLLISGEKRAPISPKQARLLRYMMEAPARVYSRQHLLETVWQNPSLEQETVTVMMVRLRRLLGHIGSRGTIKTVSKAGYLLQF